MFKSLKRFFNRPSNPAGNVYYARLATPQGTFYKIGYTTQDTLAARLAYDGRGHETLIDEEILFSYRPDAWDVEQDLLEHFDRHRAFGKYSNDPSKPLAGSGQSELFRFDVLGLDEALYREPDEPTRIEDRKGTDEDGTALIFILVGLVLLPFTLGISLFLLIGGLAHFFGRASRDSAPSLAPRRPTHPAHVHKLLSELVSNCTLAKRRRAAKLAREEAVELSRQLKTKKNELTDAQGS